MNTVKQDSSEWAEGLNLMAGPYFLGLYQPSPETKGFWEGVSRHELLLKWCSACQRAHHPKRIVCTGCGSADLSWQRSSGRGKVYSFSEVHHVADKAFMASVPYTIGLVALDEGVYLLSRLLSELGPIAIDQLVQLDFQVLESGRLLPVFKVGRS
jgi:uncharacterized OB-fold protein